MNAPRPTASRQAPRATDARTLVDRSRSGAVLKRYPQPNVRPTRKSGNLGSGPSASVAHRRRRRSRRRPARLAPPLAALSRAAAPAAPRSTASSATGSSSPATAPGAGAPTPRHADVWIDFTAGRDTQPAKLHGLWLPQPTRRCAGAALPARRTLERGSARRRASAACRNWASRCWASTTAASARARPACPPKTWPTKTRARPGTGWRAQYPTRPLRLRPLAGRRNRHRPGRANVDDERGAIVEGTFTSIPDVSEHLKWGWLPVGPLITQRFDSASQWPGSARRCWWCTAATTPDRQRARPRAVRTAPSGQKRFLLVEGGSHHSTNGVGQAQYREALAELFGLPTL